MYWHFHFTLVFFFSSQAGWYSISQLAAYMFLTIGYDLITGLFTAHGEIITYNGHKKIISNYIAINIFYINLSSVKFFYITHMHINLIQWMTVVLNGRSRFLKSGVCQICIYIKSPLSGNKNNPKAYHS